MNTPRFWPLDFDPEGEIYDNVSWDLPGYKRIRQFRPLAPPPRRKKSRHE